MLFFQVQEIIRTFRLRHKLFDNNFKSYILNKSKRKYSPSSSFPVGPEHWSNGFFIILRYQANSYNKDKTYFLFLFGQAL